MASLETILVALVYCINNSCHKPTKCIQCFVHSLQHYFPLSIPLSFLYPLSLPSIVLDTNNALVKIQVFELLSALCVYSIHGHQLALDALKHYKVWCKCTFQPTPLKLVVAYGVRLLTVPSCFFIYFCPPPPPSQRTKGHRYRFSLLLQEIRNAETQEYAAVILAFINCIIAGSPDLSQRVALRNEFIGNNITVHLSPLHSVQ